MKEILGSIAAAALLGIGCAHGQKGQARAEVPDPQDTSPIAQQAQAGGMTSSQGSPALSCTVVRPGASSTQRSQSLQEDSGTGGSAAAECVPSETDPAPSLGQSNMDTGSGVSSSALESTESQPQDLNTDMGMDTGVGGAGNAEVDDNPAPVQPGQPNIGSSIQQDSAIIPPATRSERDVAPPDILSEDMPADELGTGGAGNTGVGINAAPAPSGLDAIGDPTAEESVPADTQMAPASEPAEDLGTGGAGNTDLNTGSVGNTDKDVTIAPAPAGRNAIGGSASQPAAPTDTPAAPASESAPDLGTGGAGNTDLNAGSAGNTDEDTTLPPAPAGQNAIGGATSQPPAPTDTPAAPASEPAPVDSQFQDTGMGGAGGGGG
ncbi:hypothetical protein SAMN05444354_11765 [Stigmatella aurantiaca]|uniref:Lipoprotein n=1 Tax=Stigmatella aurantiaca TaxID=41 RepID=A0A1H7YLT6_STIAU|nr:hypothetical protein [Stigmatella aurantiaca]SEM46794.1 hypothetical protein SAMN05444354_11765 [Stigmatella aurantiaca]